VAWLAVNLAAPEFDVPTEPPALCELIYTGKRHALSGPPEAAKTLGAAIFGLEHMRATQKRFALIDFEMGEHATRLLLSDLGATLEEIRQVYYVAAEGPPKADDLYALSEAGVTLAVIDSAAGAYAVSGLDDNKRQDAETFSRAWIGPLWQLGITTVVLDHVPKNTEARGRYAIGSERKLGVVDVHLGFEPVKALTRGGHGLIRVVTHKDRPGHLNRPAASELELHSDPETHRITWAFQQPAAVALGTGGFRPTTLMDRVLEFMAANPEPISRTALAKSVTGNRYEWKLRAVDQLLAEGRLAMDGRKVVPCSGNVPGTLFNGERSQRSPLTEGTLSGTTLGTLSEREQ